MYHEKNEIMPTAETEMDLEMIILSKVSQGDRVKCHMMPLTRGS